jgi:hypothetical protein
MSKLEAIDALDEVVAKLRENAQKQDELSQTRQELVDEEIDLLEQLAAARGNADADDAPPVRQKPGPKPAQRLKPGPKPGGKRGRPPGSKNKTEKTTANGRGGKGKGRGQNAVALHFLIRDQLIEPSMPEGISFKEVVRHVTRWINIGKYKSATKDVTNICSQAMNKLKKDGDVHQPGGNKTNYMIHH